MTVGDNRFIDSIVNLFYSVTFCMALSDNILHCVCHFMHALSNMRVYRRINCFNSSSVNSANGNINATYTVEPLQSVCHAFKAIHAIFGNCVC